MVLPQQGSSSNDRPLPVGWISHYSKREERVFYKNLTTGESSWTFPSTDGTSEAVVADEAFEVTDGDPTPPSKINKNEALEIINGAPPSLVNNKSAIDENARINQIADQVLAAFGCETNSMIPVPVIAAETLPSSVNYQTKKMMEEVVNTSMNIEKKTTPARIQQKRLVGEPSKSINQMKDVTVKQVAATAVTAVSNLQRMTMYDTETKALNNPRCHTLLINYDEVIQVPRAAGDGEKGRKIPHWTILAPQGATTYSIGTMLQNLGKEMLEGAAVLEQTLETNNNKKKKAVGGKKRKDPPFTVAVTNLESEFLNSIYGKDGGLELEKKKRYTKSKTKTKAPDEEVEDGTV